MIKLNIPSIKDGISRRPVNNQMPIGETGIVTIANARKERKRMESMTLMSDAMYMAEIKSDMVLGKNRHE